LVGSLSAGLALGQSSSPPNPPTPAHADIGKQAPAKEPWQRQLTGADAKAVAELEIKLEKLQEAGSLPEAVALARQILETRTRLQGADHWQTVTMQWHLNSLRKIAALPATDQEAWARALKSEKDANAFYQNGRYTEAQPLYRKALDLRLKLLGE